MAGSATWQNDHLAFLSNGAGFGPLMIDEFWLPLTSRSRGVFRGKSAPLRAHRPCVAKPQSVLHILQMPKRRRLVYLNHRDQTVSVISAQPKPSDRLRIAIDLMNIIDFIYHKIGTTMDTLFDNQEMLHEKYFTSRAPYRLASFMSGNHRGSGHRPRQRCGHCSSAHTG